MSAVAPAAVTSAIVAIVVVVIPGAVRAAIGVAVVAVRPAMPAMPSVVIPVAVADRHIACVQIHIHARAAAWIGVSRRTHRNRGGSQRAGDQQGLDKLFHLDLRTRRRCLPPQASAASLMKRTCAR